MSETPLGQSRTVPDSPGPRPGRTERLVERGEIPPRDYANIRMAMGAATYRGVWPVGVRR